MPPSFLGIGTDRTGGGKSVELAGHFYLVTFLVTFAPLQLVVILQP